MADDEREADPVLEPSDEGEFTLGFKDGPGGIVVCARTGNFVRAVIYRDGVRNVCHFVDNGVIKNGTWVPIEPSWAAPEPRPMTDDEREQARRNAAKACELHWWQDKPGDVVTKPDYPVSSDPYGEAARACAGWAERYATWLRDRIANAPDGRTPPPETPADPEIPESWHDRPGQL